MFCTPVKNCLLTKNIEYHINESIQYVIIYISCRWVDLPNMPTARYCASALCLRARPEAVLVVGGMDIFSSETPRCAELLTHTEGASGGGEGAWRWRKLNEMNEGRIDRPGMLLLHAGGDRQRVLVAGGGSGTADILQLSCSDPSDRGQWTRIAPLSEEFFETLLVEFSSRIFAIGSFLVCNTPSFSKD